MNWTVEWTPDADNALATAWVGALNRRAITKSANDIERQLARDPHLNSIPTSEGLNCLDVPPLRVLIEIDDATRIVQIVDVRLIP